MCQRWGCNGSDELFVVTCLSMPRVIFFTKASVVWYVFVLCEAVKRVCRHDVMLGGRRRNLCRSTIWAWWLAGMLERQGNAGIQSVQRMNPFHGWKR